MLTVKTKKVKINDQVSIGGNNGFALMAGPCVIENFEHTVKICEELKAITTDLDIPFIFKASFDKANRTSVESFRGPGITEGLKTLDVIKNKFNVPIVTDVHNTADVAEVSKVADIVQIPAFLSRQTDMLVECGAKANVTNIKKGQFMAPEQMATAVKKIESAGTENILLTERGVSFGYNNLVVDFRGVATMRELTGYPVIFDATHSVQKPAAQGTCSGGDREMVSYLARAATAVGIDGLFMEVHFDPDSALCDGPNSIALKDLSKMLTELKAIDTLVKGL